MITDDELVQARQMFPLPDDVEDVIMNRAQLATAFDTSENTIGKWVGKGMPVIETGTRGNAYQFQPSDCYAWRMWQSAAEKARKQLANASANRLRAKFLNVSEADDPSLKMTARQVKDEAEAEKARIHVAAMRREYVHAGDMRELLEDVFMIVRNGLETVPDFAEMELSLTPEQVVTLKERCDQVLVDIQTRVTTEFGPKGMPM